MALANLGESVAIVPRQGIKVHAWKNLGTDKFEEISILLPGGTEIVLDSVNSQHLYEVLAGQHYGTVEYSNDGSWKIPRRIEYSSIEHAWPNI